MVLNTHAESIQEDSRHNDIHKPFAVHASSTHLTQSRACCVLSILFLINLIVSKFALTATIFFINTLRFIIYFDILLHMFYRAWANIMYYWRCSCTGCSSCGCAWERGCWQESVGCHVSHSRFSIDSYRSSCCCDHFTSMRGRRRFFANRTGRSCYNRNGWYRSFPVVIFSSRCPVTRNLSWHR